MNDFKKMKKYYKKSQIKGKKSIKVKKKKFYHFKEEKNTNIILYLFFLLIKLIFLILLYNFHSFCYNYRKKIIDNFYKRRTEFVERSGNHYNESNIVTYDDKLNWLMIHETTKLKVNCADKILVHQYSKRILKKDICNKSLKIYDNPEQINIDELPEKFVLKANHGFGYNIIVTNKTRFNVEKAKQTLSEWLKTDFGKNSEQFHYSFIKRKVFAEEFIGKELIGKDLIDYKFLCCNGIPRYIYIIQTINGIKYVTYFDINFNKLDFVCDFPNHPTAVNFKPKNLELMKEYARKLSKPFKFVRVDLYEVFDEVRLGELTFSPRNSFTRCKNRKHEIELGKYLKLF